MSAFIINREPSGVGITVITDAAVCIPRESAFELIETKSKVHRLPDESGILCCVGAYDVFTLLIEHSSESWTSFDSLLDTISEGLAQAAQRALWLRPNGGNTIMVGLAGWSEKRGRFESYAIQAGKNVQEDKLLILEPLHELEMMPFDEDAYRIAMEKTGGAGVGCLYELMEQMRLVKIDSANNPHLGEVYGIGGFMEKIVITRRGIETEIVKHWPDIIGHPIDPMRAAC